MSGCYIYLSIEEAQRAVRTKESLEALSLTLMIKATFRSSRVNNPTIRNLKTILHSGSIKVARSLKNALKFGYVRYDGHTLVANPIKGVGGDYTVRVEFERTVKDGSPIRFADAARIIRQAIVLNHIKKQNDHENTINGLRSGSLEGKAISIATYHRLASRAKRMSRTRCCSYTGLSNAKMMKLTNASRYTARKNLKQMVATGLITRHEVIEETGILPENFTHEAPEYMRQIGFSGYFFYSSTSQSIVCQRTNIYQYTCDLIRKNHKAA